MDAKPAFQRLSSGALKMGHSEEARKIRKTSGPYTCKTADAVRKQAIDEIQQHGGDWQDELVVLGQHRIQFGMFIGQTFRWMLENGLGYSGWLVDGLWNESLTDTPLSDNKFKFKKYLESFDEGKHAVELKKRERTGTSDRQSSIRIMQLDSQASTSTQSIPVSPQVSSNPPSISESEAELNSNGHPTQVGMCPQPELRDCPRCPKYAREILSLKKENKKLKTEYANLKVKLAVAEQRCVANEAVEFASPPRPGKIGKDLAATYKYVQLTPGDEVYVPSKFVTLATKKAKQKSATACARFLVRVFYSQDELLEMNVKGKNGKDGIDPDIRSSIVAFTQANSQQPELVTEAMINLSIGNMISAVRSRKLRP